MKSVKQIISSVFHIVALSSVMWVDVYSILDIPEVINSVYCVRVAWVLIFIKRDLTLIFYYNLRNAE